MQSENLWQQVPFLKDTLLAAFLLFMTGSSYSLGVFDAPIQRQAIPKHSLNDVWTGAMAFMTLCAIPPKFFGGCYISRASSPSNPDKAFPRRTEPRTYRIRILCLIGSISQACLSLGGYGVGIGSPALLQSAVMILGAGSGLLYFVAIELIAACNEKNTGLAVGIGQMAFGLGTVTFSSVFHHLTSTFNITTAMNIAALVLTVPCLLSALFLEWPPQYTSSVPNDTLDFDPPETSEISLTLSQLPSMPSFWLYTFATVAAQAGFAFIPFYFDMGQAFGAEMSVILATFQISSMLSALCKPFVGLCIDKVKTHRGFFSLGSKNMMLIFMMLQTFSFFLLIPVTVRQNFSQFVLLVGMLLIVFAGSACCPSTLAREQFGNVNSSLILGVGGSLALGLGEFITATLVALSVQCSGNEQGPLAYIVFYLIAALWSLCGVVSCIFLGPSRTHACQPLPLAPNENYGAIP